MKGIARAPRVTRAGRVGRRCRVDRTVLPTPTAQPSERQRFRGWENELFSAPKKRKRRSARQISQDRRHPMPRMVHAIWPKQPQSPKQSQIPPAAPTVPGRISTPLIRQPGGNLSLGTRITKYVSSCDGGSTTMGSFLSSMFITSGTVASLRGLSHPGSGTGRRSAFTADIVLQV
jgi:hypothetical protein